MNGVRVRVFLPVLSILLLALASDSWGAKPVPACGDGKCSGGETASSCPQDCTPAPPPVCNNDGTCNAGEDCLSCPGDCAGVTGGKPAGRYCCGARGYCDPLRCGPDCGTPLTPFCGDGAVDPGEECDDRRESAVCDADCTFRFCGDLTVNLTAGEQCDAGGESAACDADCTFAACGDGALNAAAGETCDDGNVVSGDGCSAVCLAEPPSPFCGDGSVDPGEECDDGNTVPGDGCSADCRVENPALVPSNQFTIGDSIGEGEAADGTVGEVHHEAVWSTGYDAGDVVASLNERFELAGPADYFENGVAWDPVFNHALSGAVMADFAAQAGSVAAAAPAVPTASAGMITVLMGNNDVCAPTLGEMTDPAVFEAQYRAGLDVLAGSERTRDARIHVSSIPAIYWLWEAKRTNLTCRYFVWPFVPCENLLDSPADDCASDESRQNPDVVYPGDGAGCVRRKTFHARIRDVYNPILRNVLQEYRDGGSLPNAYYVDVFGVRFESAHVNSGDCFHPSKAGHALLAEQEWAGSPWAK
jgi:cysteine-rich repeat protein